METLPVAGVWGVAVLGTIIVAAGIFGMRTLDSMLEAKHPKEILVYGLWMLLAILGVAVTILAVFELIIRGIT